LNEDTVANEVVGNRRLTIKRFRTVEEIKTCHILYISDSEAAHLSHICGTLRASPVLTVSDIDNAALRGIIIGLEKVRNRIRFQINLEAAKAANLTLSSKLLRTADVVGPDRE
jgi:YfiR/HmsC-like